MDPRIEKHVLKRFEILEKIGCGAYGIVWRAEERKTGRLVALKKIMDAFRNSTDALRTFREVVLLRELGNHKNIVRLYEVIPAKNDTDIYLVFEYMESDLYAVIRAGILQAVHIKYLMRQLVRVVHYMHSANVLHRDLKPGNLLVNSSCLLKVCDFGLARAVGSMEDSSFPFLTDYVATRWYRAPELLLGSHSYSTGVDTWAIGCIFAELLNGKVLFKGQSSSTFGQLEKIAEICPLSVDDFGSFGSAAAQTVMRRLRPAGSRNLVSMFQKCPADAVDLLQRLLVFNPSKRMAIEDAIRHPYLEEFAHPNEMTISDRIVQMPTDDGFRYSSADYRKRLYALVHDHTRVDKRQNNAVEATTRSRHPPRTVAGEEEKREHVAHNCRRQEEGALPSDIQSFEGLHVTS